MKVILQKEVASLGDAGEVKKVADGYARNYLIPRKLVIPARVGSTRALEHQKRMLARKEIKRKSAMESLSTQLKEIPSLELPMPTGENRKLFGSVTNRHISEILASQGFAIDRKKIEISNKIRSLGVYTIPVHLMNGLSIPIKVNVVPDEKSLQRERAKEEELEKERLRKEEREAKKAERTQKDSPEASPQEPPVDLTGEAPPSIEETEATSEKEAASPSTEAATPPETSEISPSEAVGKEPPTEAPTTQGEDTKEDTGSK